MDNYTLKVGALPVRLPRPRFTIRQMLVAVAIVGIVIGFANRMNRRSARFLKLSDYHQRQIISILSGPCDRDDDFGGVPVAYDWKMRPVTGVHWHKDVWHERMYRKYRDASRHTWLPVWPDPPEPE